MSAGPNCPCVAMLACTGIVVPWNCLCFYASCHCNAKLPDDVEFLYKTQEAKAVAIGQCVDMLVTEPQPDEPMPQAHQDMCSGKGKGTGMLLRVPQLGDEDGPMWVKKGWTSGYKLFVGDVPNGINHVAIRQYCHGEANISIHEKKDDRGHAYVYAIVTFIDVALAIKAFEQLAMAKFLHDSGTSHWPVVKWSRGFD